MKCERADNWVTLEFEEQEQGLLIFSLEEMEELYSEDPASMKPAFQEYWRGLLSKESQSRQELGDSVGDLAEARLAWKAERHVLVQKWLAPESSLRAEGPSVLILDQSEAEQFLSVLNDRRLLLAAEHHIGEELMARNPLEIEPVELQHAVWEVHFLSIIQQAILEVLL